MHDLRRYPGQPPIRLQRGVCASPGCSRAAAFSSFCIGCWHDLTLDERAAVLMAQRSPFRPELQVTEEHLAVLASAGELAWRQRVKEARHYMSANASRRRRHKGPWS